MFDFKTNPFNIPPVEKRCQSLTENKDREDILFLAKLAEQAERYDEMKEFMKIVTQMNMGSEPPLEERELFSMAYKRCIMKMRCNFKLMKEAEAKLTTISVDTLNEKQDSSLKLKDLATYRLTAEHEIRKTAHELLNLIDEYCLPFCSSPEAKVFFYKLRADYYRYLCEIKGDSEDKENALSAYKAANDISVNELKPTDPMRLGLALNFSVFYYEILNSPDRACRLAKAAFDEAIGEVDRLTDSNYKDTVIIMQLIRNNLCLWCVDDDRQ